MFGSKTRKLSRLQKKYRSLALELAEHKALIQTVEHQIKMTRQMSIYQKQTLDKHVPVAAKLAQQMRHVREDIDALTLPKLVKHKDGTYHVEL